jgi:hypothetical protein
LGPPELRNAPFLPFFLFWSLIWSMNHLTAHVQSHYIISYSKLNSKTSRKKRRVRSSQFTRLTNRVMRSMLPSSRLYTFKCRAEKAPALFDAAQPALSLQSPSGGTVQRAQHTDALRNAHTTRHHADGELATQAAGAANAMDVSRATHTSPAPNTVDHPPPPTPQVPVRPLPAPHAAQTLL